MSWEDILKKESGLEFLLDDIHPSYNEKTTQEESVDFSDSEDAIIYPKLNEIEDNIFYFCYLFNTR